MPSNPFVMSVSPTTSIPILVGNTAGFTLSFQNTSTTNRIYNLTIQMTVPNGLTLSSATLTQTTSVTNPDNSITYSWTNIKDLAPQETPYIFNITLKCSNTFKNGTTIPFGYQFSNINILAQTDTMPRGQADIGNIVLTAQSTLTFTTTMFNGTITTPGKVLKGAGTSLTTNDYTQISTATCKLTNNAVSTSLVGVTILLDNGIRYLGNVRTSGTDASQLLSPVVNYVQINGLSYTQLFFNSITLSQNSVTTLLFDFAVWNQLNANQGTAIPHGTPLNMSINVSSSTYSIKNVTTFLAMDVILTTTISKSIIDVQNTVTYTFNYATGGYYNLQNIVLHYLLPDGIYYVGSSFTPISVVNSSVYKGYYITYNFPYSAKNSTTTGTITAKVNNYYQYIIIDEAPAPVVSFDNFLATTDISANPITLTTTITDTASVPSSITIGTIKKQFIKAFYQDGTPKAITALAPLDYAEYLLTYTASTINAQQNQVYIDDFFPLSADPITNLTYTYTGNQPIIPPILVDPHGVDFYYGNLPGKSALSIDFKVPIASLGTPSQNINLMKLKATNTAGVAYSNRTQVTINIGTPNLQLTKTVSGPNTAAIKSNEVYTYTVKLTNTNTLGTETDAFNISLSDTLSSWFTLNPNSVSITGTGIYSNYQVTSSAITVFITSLAPGQSITLTYSVTISSVIAPGVTITTTATNTNPYAQSYNASLPNYQYTNLIKTASTTIASQGIAFIKSNNTDTFKVNSPIIYTITLTIPQGTIAYNVSIKDILSSGNQIYTGPCYRNNVLISPSISSNTITFPSEGTIDARTTAQTLTYIFYCKITNGTKSINATTSIQNNTYQCLYQQQASGGTTTTISKILPVTINHPNIVLNLSCTDQSTSITSTQTVVTNINSSLLFNLQFQNNSNIRLVNGTVQIPISANFIFSNIVSTVNCNAYYNSTSGILVITIPELDPGMTGFINYTLLPNKTLIAGTTATQQAKAISYYNDISTTKVYTGETSNTITVTFPPNLELIPNPLTKINHNTSFTVTKPGDTATIIDYFTNTGGGYDSFSISIAPARIAYTLSIENQVIATVPANTAYTQTPTALANVPPNIQKPITITALIPSTSQLGARYDFNITATSLTTPYPSQTVYNIDPF